MDSALNNVNDLTKEYKENSNDKYVPIVFFANIRSLESFEEFRNVFTTSRYQSRCSLVLNVAFRFKQS